MSGDVGSTPSFTRSGLPVFAHRSSFFLRSSSRIRSTVPFFRYSSCSSMVIGKVIIVQKERPAWALMNASVQISPRRRELIRLLTHERDGKYKQAVLERNLARAGG